MSNKRRFVTRILFTLLVIQPALGCMVYNNEVLAAVNNTPVANNTEFRVNTTIAGSQNSPSVSSFSDGGFVTVWTDSQQDGSFDGIFAQRYDALGNPTGGEFQVNSETANSQSAPYVAALADDGFVVVWMSNQPGASIHEIYGQRYDATGNPVGIEFQINTYTADDQTYPVVSSLTNGGFVVTWISFGWDSAGQDGSFGGIYGQRYDALGNTAGNEFRINTTTSGFQMEPSVASLADNGFVVTWHSNDISNYGIWGQRYDGLGNPVGNEFQVNTYTDSHQYYPSVSSLDDGGFVVTWMSKGQDGSLDGIYVQRYDALGNPDGGEFQANTYTASAQSYPSAIGLADGGFVIAWQSNLQDGSNWSVFGQRYDALGNPAGSEFLMNTFIDKTQAFPVMVPLPDGGFIAVWQSLGSEQDDNSAYGIYARLFDTTENDNPTASDDSATTNEDVAVTIDVLINDSDLDGDALSITSITQGTNGSVTNNGTDVSYTPNANFNGIDSFTYTIDDGNGGTATATVTVTVIERPVNFIPSAVDDSTTTNEDVAVSIDALENDTDADGDSLSITQSHKARTARSAITAAM